MSCQWQLFLKLLPPWLREPVDRLGKSNLTELRMRIGRAPELVLFKRSIWLNGSITTDDMQFCINAASQFSPWAASSVPQGFITAPGGHRIGICGEAILSNGTCSGFHNISSLCLRVARDFPEISAGFQDFTSSVLIIGPPGSGKTTLLRDMIRARSNRGPGSVAVVDERGEIFPTIDGAPCFTTGMRTDILSGVSKARGIISLIRTMGACTVAADEITEEEDCQALIHASFCGVSILATAHADSISDLYKRVVYKPIIERRIFDSVIILQRDKSWKVERIHYDS